MQTVCGLDQARQTGALGNILIYQPSKFFNTVLAKRHPDLERAKPARRLNAEIMKPLRRSQAAFCSFQIFRCQRKRGQMCLFRANERTPDLERRMQPFVRIKGD